MKFANSALSAMVAAGLASWITYRAVSDEFAKTDSVEAAARAQAIAVSNKRIQAPALDAEASTNIARLTSENASLKAKLEEALAATAEREATLKATRAQLEELRRPFTADLLSSALRAELKSGEVVVTGGYKLADGRRLYAFATPTITQENGVDVVRVRAHYLQLTDEAGKSVGLDSLATNSANSLQHGEVWVPSEATSVMEQLATTAGVDALSSPSITLPPGMSGSLSIDNITMKVTPGIADATGTMGFEIHLEQPQPVTTPPAGAVSSSGSTLGNSSSAPGASNTT